MCEPCSLGIFGDIGWEHVREIWDGVGVASTARAQLTDVLSVGRARAVRGHSSRAASNGFLFSSCSCFDPVGASACCRIRSGGRSSVASVAKREEEDEEED